MRWTGRESASRSWPCMSVFVAPSSRLIAVLLVGVLASADAQSRAGARPVMDRQQEMALARSAAPTVIGSAARVWLWDGAKYVVGDSGTSPINCYVGRPWVPSVEPHCFDVEGSRTVMPVLMRRVELYAQGKADAAVEREIAAGLKAGRYRVPRRPALSWMMSAHQELVNGGGHAVGRWQPHLMIFFPDLPDKEMGLSGFVQGVGFVENPRTPWAAMVLPVSTFVDTTAKKSNGL